MAALLAAGLVWWTQRRTEQLEEAPAVEEQFYSSGGLKSRTAMRDGLPDGLSEGYYTNGILQVTEYFQDGISHGVRTKWYSTGEKKSEAEIVHAQIDGRFRTWYKNGQLAEDAGFSNGIPHGTSYAWYEDGRLKAEVTMERGEVVEQQYWDPSGIPMD